MKHTIELQPFSTPNFVRPIQKVGTRQNGFIESPTIPLSDLSVETLESLCKEFRLNVLAKAGKR